MPDRVSSLTPTSVQLAVGPVIYGIVLQPEDPGQMRTAVEVASQWWGGISFPWLALNKSGALPDDAAALCSVLDVAGIVDLTRADDHEKMPAGLQEIGLPVTVRRQRPDWAMPVRGALPSSMSRPLVTAAMPEDGDAGLDGLVAMGSIALDEQAKWEEAGQAVAAVQVGGDSLLAQIEGQTAIAVTAAGTDSVVADMLFPTTAALVWVLPDTFTLAEVARDLGAFWNYRALRLWPRRTVTVLARLSSLSDPGCRDRLLGAISATAFSTPMCVFNGLAIEDAALQAAAEALGFRVVENGEWTEHHTQERERLELTAVINRPLASFWAGERHAGTSKDALAVAHRPRWKARVESPLQWRYPEAHNGLVSARITSPVITGPRTDTVAALYQMNSRWRAGGVRIFTRAMPTYHLDLGMPHPAEVLAAALAARGRTLAVSDKGREIDGILNSCDDLTLFRRPAFHAVTAALTPQASPRIEKALNQLAEKVGPDPDLAAIADELRYITARARAKPPTLNDLATHMAVRDQNLRRADVSATLNDMLAHGLVTWGYERTCGLCGLLELVPLSSATPVPRCPGCGRDATYTRRDQEPVLHYALGGLLQRVSRNAGLTPLAAAAALRQQDYYVVPGATITGGAQVPDTDLLAWNGYQLLAGEAKAAAALFDQDKLVLEIGEAAAMGATIYLMACPEIIPDEVLVKALAAAQDSEIELLQLTGGSLTSNMPMTHAVPRLPPQPDDLQGTNTDT